MRIIIDVDIKDIWTTAFAFKIASNPKIYDIEHSAIYSPRDTGFPKMHALVRRTKTGISVRVRRDSQGDCPS